jgi:hypothetical protein
MTMREGSSNVDRDERSHIDPGLARLVRNLAAIVGAVFLLVGVLGFIPGITTHVDRMELAGHDSPSELLGLFQVSVLHNFVHLAFGVVGLVAARQVRSARSFLLIGGLVYLALFAFGLIIDLEDEANFVPLNDADNWLHLGLGLGMLALGVIPIRRADNSHRDARPGRETAGTR